MPKYSYKCTICDHHFVVHHGIKDKFCDCPQCDNKDSLTKEINRVHIGKKQPTTHKQKTGELTKQSIEENKVILKDYKKELKNNEYDDTKDTS